MLDQVFGGLYVPRGEQQNTLSLGTVPSCAARFLIVALQTLGHVIMDHIGHVGFVDAHAEGIGSHHNGLPVIEEVLLIFPAFLIRQARMVPGRRDIVQLQVPADLLHRLPGSAVDDPRFVPALTHQLQKGWELLGRFLNLEAQIGPVKACDDPQRVPQLQDFGDVLPHQLRSRGRKGGYHRPGLYNVQKIHDFQVAGPEILTPLGNAVGLVHRHQRDLPGLDRLQETIRQQPFRSHIDDLVHAAPDVAVHQPDLIGRQGAVDIGRRHPGIFQGHDLIPHQGDQRRDHQSDSVQQQSRNLVAQAFAAAGGHDAEGIPAGQLGVDQRLLAAPKGRIAKDPLQDRFFCLHLFLSSRGRPRC